MHARNMCLVIMNYVQCIFTTCTHVKEREMIASLRTKLLFRWHKANTFKEAQTRYSWIITAFQNKSLLITDSQLQMHDFNNVNLINHGILDYRLNSLSRHHTQAYSHTSTVTGTMSRKCISTLRKEFFVVRGISCSCAV